MEMAKISSKGQITIPIEIRKKLKLKEGDKVLFIEEGNRIIFANASIIALQKIQKEMKGEAEKADIYSEEDVIGLVNEVRKGLWEKKYENND
ncbi:MAG: AbrB/MazE/SpoVT family DNA-binding domain-containing protein [Bacillota bacterium]|nr:AbrB/MazE/SpoVT family DNA-binding domain-containing protein [Bacillota bacterium]MDD3850618.1 AbrB/MazE/SpoVT family DNA-binding domain-containing protein [Bacillota bacterium]